MEALLIALLAAGQQSLGYATSISIGIALLLRAFAAGCTALTGIKAIADGVPAFKQPESKNAAITLVIMAVALVLAIA